MEKKELKLYVSPKMEVVEMEMQGILCVSTSVPGVDVEGPDGEI